MMESVLGSTLESKVIRILRRRDGKLVPANLLAIVLIILFLISLLMIALLGFAYVSVLERLASFNRQVYDRPGHDDRITKDALNLLNELIQFRDRLFDFGNLMKKGVEKQAQDIASKYKQLSEANKTQRANIFDLSRQIKNFVRETNKSLRAFAPICREDLSELVQKQAYLLGITSYDFEKDINDIIAQEQPIIKQIVTILLPSGALFFIPSESFDKSLWKLEQKYDDYHPEVRQRGGLFKETLQEQQSHGENIRKTIENQIYNISGDRYSQGDNGNKNRYQFKAIFVDKKSTEYIYDPKDTVDLLLIRRI